jgi:hypothetical protein
MDVNVFVSSTSRDLGADCRPAVLGAIRTADDILKAFEAGRAAAVAMEDWDAEYEPPLQVSLEKIRVDSTHYVGILGYLRGFVPGGAGEGAISITEAEWNHALKYRGRSCIAMFVPKDHSPFAEELQKRAQCQTAAQFKAQMKFHEKILREGTAQQFVDIADLDRRVIRKVVIWAKSGLREVARASQVTKDAAGPLRRPGSSDLAQLGRREQLARFVDALQEMEKAAVFLVYGPRGFGHLELMARLVREVEANAFVQPRCYVVSAGALWRDSGPAALLHAVGREIRPGWEPSHTSVLAKELLDLLEDQDVILQISGLEAHAGGLPAFLADLWNPLAGALPAGVPNRLICLAAVVAEDEKLDLSLSGDDATAGQNRPAGPIILPRLRPFTEQELSFWLKSRLPGPKANALSLRLMTATDGIPQALYAVLADAALWEQ